MQAMLDNAFSRRSDFRVVGFCSDATVAADMIRQLKPDVVTIDFNMPYLDGAFLLEMVADLKNVCKVVVSDQPAKNLLLNSKLIQAGAAACLTKTEFCNAPDSFFQKVNAAIDANLSARRLSRALNAKQSNLPMKAANSDEPIERSTFPVPADEKKRIVVLQDKNLLNSRPERQFDLITKHVAKATGFPVCLLTFIDRDVQWIKSSSGFETKSTPRSQAFCNYTIAQGGAFVVANAARDERFANNPLVKHGPTIRSYAGHPIVTSDGVTVGALCVIDNRVRTVTKAVLDELAGMSEIVAELINARPAIAA
jgi:DNA-binding NarL/FixJ family response regulator